MGVGEGGGLGRYLCVVTLNTFMEFVCIHLKENVDEYLDMREG